MATSSFETVETRRKINKSARLIIRNLSFSCKEEELHNHYSEFGTVEEVVLLRRNGRLVGCGFVQFNKKLDAAKALSKTNGKPFLGRTIIVDWAVPKNKFHSVKYRNHEKDSSECDDEETLPRKPVKKEKQKFKKLTENEPKKITNDVLDGKTVFFKDIPFQTTNENFKKCAEELAGPVEYAVICVDPFSDHPKGTGFIRFKEIEVAEQVLNNEKQLILFGKQISSHKMLSKENLEIMKRINPTSKDKRNLYLIKEGAVLAGSTAAKGVSQTDMSKRLFLEQLRSRQLRNLHKFISTTRLVIYNLPIKYFDNKKLLKLFKTHSSNGVKINEARVMRDLKTLDDNGIPISKGYGYVSFEKHQDALTALRAINNNPKIFTEKKRPIVSFSIEDKKALLLKKKRQEKVNLFKLKCEKINKCSRSKSNICSSNNSDYEATSEMSKTKNNTKKKDKNIKYLNTRSSSSTNFVGASGKRGEIKLSSKRKLNNQAKVHQMEVKKELIKQKLLKSKISRKQTRLKKLKVE